VLYRNRFTKSIFPFIVLILCILGMNDSFAWFAPLSKNPQDTIIRDTLNDSSGAKIPPLQNNDSIKPFSDDDSMSVTCSPDFQDAYRDFYLVNKKAIYYGRKDLEVGNSNIYFQDLDESPLFTSDAVSLEEMLGNPQERTKILEQLKDFFSGFISGFGENLLDIYDMSDSPSKDEIFVMGEPLISALMGSALNAPGFLIHLSQVEKEILFGYWDFVNMDLHDSQYDALNRELVEKTRKITEYFQKDLPNSLNNQMALIFDNPDLAFLSYENLLSEEQKESLLHFWAFDIPMDDDRVAGANNFTRDWVNKYSGALKKKYEISDLQLNNGLGMIKITVSTDFSKEFIKKFGKSFETARSESLDLYPSDPDSKFSLDKFKSWWEKQKYSPQLDMELYNKVYPIWFNAKLMYVTKLYIENILNKLNEYNIDRETVTTYVLARAHLRELAKFAIMRSLFIQCIDDEQKRKI
jgi:hypothetical protein